MKLKANPLQKEEILRLAARSKLMLELGDEYCVNDIAGEKELLAFARLLEDRLTLSRGTSRPNAAPPKAR